MLEFFFLREYMFNPLNVEELKTLIANNIAFPADKEKMNILQNYILQNYTWQTSARNFADTLSKHCMLIS
jgi:hypothetical protein